MHTLPRRESLALGRTWDLRDFAQMQGRVHAKGCVLVPERQPRNDVPLVRGPRIGGFCGGGSVGAPNHRFQNLLCLAPAFSWWEDTWPRIAGKARETGQASELLGHRVQESADRLDEGGEVVRLQTEDRHMAKGR